MLSIHYSIVKVGHVGMVRDFILPKMIGEEIKIAWLREALFPRIHTCREKLTNSSSVDENALDMFYCSCKIQS
jgi:hypothetical protein